MSDNFMYGDITLVEKEADSFRALRDRAKGMGFDTVGDALDELRRLTNERAAPGRLMASYGRDLSGDFIN